MKKVKDSEVVGYETINGEQVPIIHPEVHMEVLNIKTGVEYDSELDADKDVADPNTEITIDDIKKDVLVKVVKLPDVFGKNEKE
tara:strand:+ start:390 stop:641 length:252 start_codon:yes stop_codon:yes gene_type:complete